MRFKSAIVLLLLAVVLAPSGKAATPPTLVERIPQYLTDSGYQFVQKSPTVWYTTKTSKTLKDFKVIIAAAPDGDLIVIFVTVARKRNMRVTPEFMTTLLKLNHELDRVKIEFDDDGDLAVRADCTGRILDAQELKTQIEQVAAAAAATYDAALPYISQ
jgi:ribosome-interacting GTPase 1